MRNPPVVLVAPDRDLRETLAAIVSEAGYRVVGVGDTEMALVALRATTLPQVVVLTDGLADNTALLVLQRLPYLPKHVYLVLSTDQSHAPAVVNMYTARQIPVIEEPFDLDRFLDRVDEAAALAATSAPVARVAEKTLVEPASE
ncbi:MAG: hypothetical protein OJF49_004210 [Ktedonobacterales bacterium]|jgi:DNA-binding NtrC family response regulator|nr:MAG: hypothetical protein OJF49_004210 [Ktedonobacterales bacterium]